jgi:hypothetical protein
MNKKFKEPNNTAVFTTKFVVEDKKDITTVYHFAEDGAWQFSSDDIAESFEEVARVVGLGQIISLDGSILQIADLPEGYCAQRNFKNDSWKIGPIPE